jgi:purine nucleosidase
MRPRRLLLDTDIGTNVDDCLALAAALASPEIELVAVTTVHGDVTLRARIAMKLLMLAGAEGIPVACGADLPMSGGPSVYWEGHEGQGLLESDDLALQPVTEHAVDLIIREALDHRHETWFLGIGPLTNLALALLKEPALGRTLAGVTVMGGVAGELDEEMPPADRNFRSDPEAARTVLAAGIPIHLAPLGITSQVRIYAQDVAAIAAVGDPFHLAIARQIQLYRPYHERGGWTYLHDPLALATVIHPDMVEWEPVRGQVEAGPVEHPGRLILEPDSESPNVNLARQVQANRAREWIMRCLTGRVPFAHSTG